MPFLIIFGIRGGVFTATEGGAIVSAYALAIDMFVYKEIKFSDILKICFQAAGEGNRRTVRGDWRARVKDVAGCPYVIFPGNVGETATLRETVEILLADEPSE